MKFACRKAFDSRGKHRYLIVKNCPVLLALGFLLAFSTGMEGQYRPAGAAGATGDIGRLSIELPVRVPVYTATVQVYLGEQQVATRSVKKDSATDKSRIADIRNLKEGLYTLKIESPGMPDILQQVFVRNEKDPVRIYLEYPQNAFPASSPYQTENGGGDLMLRIQRMEERIKLLESRGTGGSRISSKRSKKPVARRNDPPALEDQGLQSNSGNPDLQQPATVNKASAGQNDVKPDELQDPAETKPSKKPAVKVEKGKKRTPKRTPARERPALEGESEV